MVFGLGSFASTMLTSVVVTWLLYYATGSHQGAAAGGAGHGLFGLGMAVGRIADALADPFVGRWSDRTRTRLGRRLPFVLGGAIPLGLLFVLLWLPYTDASLLARAVRVAVTLTAFFAVYTVVVCPYLAMLPEIAVDPRTRLRLATWQAAGSVLGGGAVVLFAPRLFDELGYVAGATVIGGLAVVCYLLVGLVFLNGPRQEAPVRRAANEGLAGPLRAAWRLVAGERAFGMYLLGFAALWIGLNILSISLPYLVTIVLGRPQRAVATLGMVNLASTAVAVPWIGRVAAQFGKVVALRGAAVLLAVTLPLIAAGGAGVWIALVVAGPALALVYILPHPILAEITDRHRRRHGDGEEALHFGAQGLALKGALAIAAWLAGVMFGQLGAGPDAQAGIRGVAVVAGLLCLVAVGALGRVRRELGRGD